MSKGDNVWGLVFLLIFVGVIFLALYDYFTTPSLKILPVLVIIFMSFINVFVSYGEYLGTFIPGLAKPNFITRGGAIGAYEGHKEHHSGMVTYYFTCYTRVLRHCNYFKYVHASPIKSFFLWLSPMQLAEVTDHKSMFENLPVESSDTQEGSIFYHGTLRGAKVTPFADVLKMRLQQAIRTISEIQTMVENAVANSEASAQGQNRKLVEISTQVGTIADNFTKFNKEQPIVLQNQGEKGGKE